MMKTGIALAAATATLAWGVPAQAASSALPKGFLLTEAAARGPHKDVERWKISDARTAGLLLDPCEHRYWSGKKATDRGRIASRTIVKTVEVESWGEQVALYRDVKAARTVMKGVRADLKRCAVGGDDFLKSTYTSRPLKVGDEGIRAVHRDFEGSIRFVAVRRGAAVLIYMEVGDSGRGLPVKDFRTQVKQAGTMATRVCGLPEARCEKA
ncbi:hypothetical protein [Nonomuraea endophytica]|uniref:Sensor domain-containing protein n=1 Tax=Nonomuraea endophytica TaxID=714136 RepID=A0A7W8AEN1_9ACTN|nr:hypothetical protein [Nonomuraea endophytica]MBB5083403.1 hypothetical protein [Nonomuraea endophytica]